MNQPTPSRNSLLATLRALVPNRPLRYTEALRITELRLEWMRGGPSPMAGLVNVNK